MDYNIITYLFFKAIIIVITVVVGKSLHRNGAVFLRSIFRTDLETFLKINDLLLVAYYLLNIGYALIQIQGWEDLSSLNQCVESLSTNVASIVVILASIHYTNVFAFIITAKLKNLIFTTKTDVL